MEPIRTRERRSWRKRSACSCFEIQYDNIAKKGEEGMEASIGGDFLVHIPRLSKYRQPSTHLFFDIYDSGTDFAGYVLPQTGAQQGIGWLSGTLDNRQVIGV
jgi:hypothetical protein